MSKNTQTAEACIAEWVNLKRSKGRTGKTLLDYRSKGQTIINQCRRIGITDLPYNWTDNDLKALRNDWTDRPKPLSLNTQKDYDNIIAALAAHFGNDVGERNKLTYPEDEGPNTEWLTLEEVRTIKKMWKTPLEDVAFSLAFDTGLRKGECLNLKINDIVFDDGCQYIIVHGKGRKIRRVPFGNDTPRALDRWLKHRKELWAAACEVAEKYGRKPIDNGKLIVFQRGSKLGSYSELHPQGYDNMTFISMSERAGLYVRAHMCRRTFARLLSDRIAIIKLSILLGHSNPQTTMKYIGRDQIDLSDAIKQLPE